MIGELLGEAAYAIEGLTYEPLGRVGRRSEAGKEEQRPMNGGSGIYSNAYPTRNPWSSTSMTHGRLGWRSMKQPSGVRRMAFCQVTIAHTAQE